MSMLESEEQTIEDIRGLIARFGKRRVVAAINADALKATVESVGKMRLLLCVEAACAPRGASGDSD